MPKLTTEQIEILQDFTSESRETLEQLESGIIELGKTGDDQQILNIVFRLFHSMKGSAGFLGLRHISLVAQAAGELLEILRNGGVELQDAHKNVLIDASDFLKDSLEIVETTHSDSQLAEKAETLAANIRNVIKNPGGSRAKASVKREEPIKLDLPPPPPPSPSRPVKEPKAPAHVARPATPETGLEIMPTISVTPDMVERFINESDELLQKIENDVLEWIKNPDDPEIISEIFRSVHSFKGNCGFFGYVDMEKLSHHIETLLDNVRRNASVNRKAVAEFVLEFKDGLKAGMMDAATGGPGKINALPIYLGMIDDITPDTSPGGGASSTPAAPQDTTPLLGQILIREGVVTMEDLEKALEAQQKPLGELLVEMGVASAQAVESALNRQQKVKESDTPQRKVTMKRQDIRVDLEKLDKLINLIGELVIAENMVVNNPDLAGLELENFTRATQHSSKIVRELQELAMVIRMVPVSGLFRRMIRLVHDVSVKCGKKVELELAGEDTEVDKTIIELINDPLVHMLRNAVDHGIEPPDDRIRSGKPETGMIKLSASHVEGEVWIVIEDDGRGLDREKILAKARELGLMEGDGSELSNRAVFQFIFHPGFSTADKISDVSGRGVGMDVVRQNLEKINTKIELYSRLGRGARFVMRIPLTLAIIDGMLIRVGRAKYIIPIASIRESFFVKEKNIAVMTEGQELARVRDEFIPVIRLHEMHNVTPDSLNLTDGVFIVLETPDGAVALFADEIIGQQQTVVKGLSKYLSDMGKARGISGCTILGNGEVCLILDVGSMIEYAHGHDTP